MSNSKFLRKYLNLLNEGPPPGVGPNAVVKGPNQQMGQPDTFTKMLPGMGNKAINAGKGLIDPYGKAMADLTPGSEYYQKNVANNPQAKAQVDAFMQNAPTANQLGSNVNATQQAFNKATQPTTAGGTSSEYEKSATQLGMPQVQEEEKDDTKVMRKYVDYIDEVSAREQDIQRRMANTRQAGANVALNTSQTTSGPNGSMTVTNTGPAIAINPNDKDAAAFGKQINAPVQTTTQPNAVANAPITAINPNDKNAAVFGKQINAPAQTSIAQTNTAAAAPASPAKTYGGGYDPSKVQYAYSGGKPTTPNAPPGLAAATTGQGYADQANKSPTQAPAKQNTAAPANMGGYAQSAQPNPTPPAPLAGAKTTSQPVNNQTSSYTAPQSSSLAQQYVSANQPTSNSPVTNTQTTNNTQLASNQPQTFTATGGNERADFEESIEEDELDRIKKLAKIK